MENLLTKLSNDLQSKLKDFDVFSIWLEEGELNVNSNWDIPKDYIEAIEAEIKEISKNKISPKVSDKFEEGVIIYDSWGYEQTNIDFYCIIKRKGMFVEILPMTKNRVETAWLCYDVTPNEIDYSAKSIRKKIKVWADKEQGFSLRPYSGGGWSSLWDGKPKGETKYA